MSISDERRRVQRAKPLSPLRAKAGEHRAFVIDASVKGLRLAHQAPIGPPDTIIDVRFEWDGTIISVQCAIRWSHVQNAGRGASAKSLWHSGMSIVAFTGTDSEAKLKEMIQALVARALDEQKANARGIPATAAQSFQTGTASRLMRHERVLGEWKANETTDSRQPPNGFTVAADLSRRDVELLRSSYDNADEEGRSAIRTLAAMSISTTDGIPTRKYDA